MRLQGFTSLLTLSPSCLANTNPELCQAYNATLQSTAMAYGASEFELKVICIIGTSTIFLLVASFVMEKNKRYSYDVGYKLKVIAYAEEHRNRAAQRHFGPLPIEKTIRDWQAIIFFTRLTSWESACKIIVQRRKISPLYPLLPL